MTIRTEMESALERAKATNRGPYQWRMSKDAKEALAAAFEGQLIADPAATEEKFAGLPIVTVAGAGVYWELQTYGSPGAWGRG